MDYQVGMIVEHPRMREWGPGKISFIRGDKLFVFFRDLPGQIEAKKFYLDFSPLVKAANQRDPILDNFPPPIVDGEIVKLPWPRLTVKQAMEDFIKRFPLGFDDPAYLGDKKVGERN